MKWMAILEITGVLVALLPCICPQFMNADKSRWLDPQDMFNEMPSQIPINREVGMKAEVPQNPVSVEVHADRVVSVNDAKPQQPDSVGVDPMVFMRRHIAHLLALLEFETPMQATQFYNMHIELTQDQRKKLKEFVMSRGSLHDVDDVLMDILVEAKPTSFDGIPLTFLFTSQSFQLLGVTLSILGTFYLILKLSLFRILLLLFTFSFFWNCQTQYQSAIAKHHSDMTKSNGIPRYCKPADWSWTESMKYWFRDTLSVQDDECFEYHKTLLVDPLWDINPAVAASDAVTMFVFHPLERIGGQIGLFYKNMYKNSPPFVFWFLLPMSFIFALLVVFAAFGYGISMPFGLLSITRSPRTPSLKEYQQIDREKINAIECRNQSAVETKMEQSIGNHSCHCCKSSSTVTPQLEQFNKLNAGDDSSEGQPIQAANGVAKKKNQPIKKKGKSQKS